MRFAAVSDLRLARGTDAGKLRSATGEAVPGQWPECALLGNVLFWEHELFFFFFFRSSCLSLQAVANKVLAEQQNQLGKTVEIELRRHARLHLNRQLKAPLK